MIIAIAILLDIAGAVWLYSFGYDRGYKAGRQSMVEDQYRAKL